MSYVKSMLTMLALGLLQSVNGLGQLLRNATDPLIDKLAPDKSRHGFCSSLETPVLEVTVIADQVGGSRYKPPYSVRVQKIVANAAQQVFDAIASEILMYTAPAPHTQNGEATPQVKKEKNGTVDVVGDTINVSTEKNEEKKETEEAKPVADPVESNR